jgi:hypothetical protein
LKHPMTECRDRVLNLPESSHFSKCKIGTNLFLIGLLLSYRNYI